MAEFATVARPYAKALFDLAVEKNQIESWLGGLKELAWSVQQPQVALLIEESGSDAAQKANGLLALLSDNSATQNAEFQNFVQVVAVEKRLQVLPEIYAQYQDLALSRNHTKKATVYSAYPMSEGQFAKVLADCQKQFGSNLEATLEIVPELIGGVKVEVGDQVLDLSVQAKLKRLYATMTN
ncbi:MAG: F0F1 ATP synthase subunit delta [Eikenella sp.]|nr:F0F1 ATP synthase subunit delta [Eikenella sp.]